MGRRPIGEQPMTATERSQRRRQRLQQERELAKQKEAQRIARNEARREGRSEAEQQRLDFEFTILLSSPEQIADLIMAGAHGDKAGQVAEALMRAIEAREEARELRRRSFPFPRSIP